MRRRALFAGLVALLATSRAKAKGFWDGWRPVKNSAGQQIYWESAIEANFGETPFRYSVPSGFKPIGCGDDGIVGFSVDMSGSVHYLEQGEPSPDARAFSAGDVVTVAYDPTGERPPMFSTAESPEFHCPKCGATMEVKAEAPNYSYFGADQWLVCPTCSPWT